VKTSNLTPDIIYSDGMKKVASCLICEERQLHVSKKCVMYVCMYVGADQSLAFPVHLLYTNNTLTATKLIVFIYNEDS
jgi:hypothetical protein